MLQDEARTRNATLICSLHQVDLARAQFARIVGLRAGRIVFDAPREAISDAMIAALYDNADAGPAASVPKVALPVAPVVVMAPRC